MRADLDRAKRGLPVDATPLLVAGTTQVIDRPPPPSTQVLPPPQEPERRRTWIPLVVTLILIALLGGLLWFLAANLLSDDNQQSGTLVTVPNVVGDTRQTAEQKLTDAGLTVGTITRVPAADETQAPGTVLEQDPAANEEVERQTPVDLTVVAQPEAVAIPDLEGSSLSDAQAALLDLGLQPTGPQQEPSDTVDVGKVTRTDPPAGSDADPGSRVTIFLSSGPSQVTVPLVTCQSFGSAQKEIENAGLTPVISTDTVPINSQCPHGNKVASQDPASGTTVEPGTTVTLFSGEPAPTGPTGGT
jgi:serine/threonine-protein kinase